jgi:hypothetical protein
MKSAPKDQITHKKCPPHIARALKLAGGLNRNGDPLFRVVWGWDRIVPITGQWEQWETQVATLTDKITGYSESRPFPRLVSSVIETRMEPKYLPANCWHLEMWRPPEEYGNPETWRKVGEEVLAGMTIDTAGEFPSRGEYELCYPLTDDASSRGRPLPLVGAVVEELVSMIRVGRDNLTFQQRKAAIEQRERRRDEGFVKRTEATLRDGIPAFSGKEFVTVPKTVKP